MRALVALFRFLLEVQGAVVYGAGINREDGVIEILVRRRKNALARCSICGQVMGGRIKPHERKWRHLDMMRKETRLVYQIREGCCPVHGRRVERVPWAEGAANHTKAFDRQVASLAQVADRSATSRMFNVSWRTVGRMVKRLVDAVLPRNLMDDLTAIGVDETSYKRGHRYLTVVTCQTRGIVIWVCEGKSAETLEGFFKKLGPERARKLELVTMDMSEAYEKTVKKWAPQADVVFDRFHVVKLLLEAVDELRREECRRLNGEAREALKNTRYAFLRNPCRYTQKDLEAINRIQATNRKLARVYELRVDFEELWNCKTEEKAREFLIKWTRAALLSRREPLRKFAWTVRRKMEGILGFFKHSGITNAVLEGTNNKIKLLIHRSYGFHNVTSLIAMIHLCCSGITLD